MAEWMKDLWMQFSADLKKAHKSMTIWFNGIMGTIVIALPLAHDQLPQLQDYLPAAIYHYLMGAVVFGNIILRFKTTRALAQK